VNREKFRIYVCPILGGAAEGASVVLLVASIFAITTGGGIPAIATALTAIVVGTITLDQLFPLETIGGLVTILVGFYFGIVPIVGTLFGGLPKPTGSLISPVILLFFWGLRSLTKEETPSRRSK